MKRDATSEVVIVTVTYNAAEFIERFLESVAAVLAVEPAFRLVLVDNASADASVQIAKQFIADKGLEYRATVIAQDGNVGFGRGCNAGAKQAVELGASYIWFLNPDTTVDVSAANELLACYENAPAADFVGSALKNEHGVKRSGAFRFPNATTTFLSNAKLGAFDRLLPNRTSTYPLPDKPIRVDWLTGASFMVKASVFEKLEGFDPKFFLYFEEVDLFLRAQRAGYQAWFCPSSVVYHQSGASTGINQKSAAEVKPRPSYWFESRRYFYLKNYGRAYFLLTDSAFLAGQALSRAKGLIKKVPTSEPPGLLGSIVRYSGLASGSRK